MTLPAVRAIFPGLPARLGLSVCNTFDGREKIAGWQKEWCFYNNESDRSSLINNMRILKDETGIARVNIFFDEGGCEEMQRAFPYARFFHTHAYESQATFCNLEVQNYDRETFEKRTDYIESVLKTILATQNFVGGSKSEMEKILSSL